MAQWRNISLPDKLLKQVEIVMKQTGHNSMASFIQDAIIRRIEGLIVIYPELKNHLKPKNKK